MNIVANENDVLNDVVGDVAGEVKSASKFEIRKTLGLLCDPDAVYELRVIKHRLGTIAGFYDDLDKMADDAYELTEGGVYVPGRFKSEAVGETGSVYLTLNPVKSVKISQEGMDNRLRVIPAKKDKDDEGWLAADVDVIRRRNILIDFDPWREGREIPTTDLGHRAGIRRSADVRGWLHDQGWPAGVLASSGNGGHLVYGCDLPNDDGTRDLIQSFLQAVAGRFGDKVEKGRTPHDESLIDIDTKVFNASRICTIWGTWKRKGSDRPDRPHRLSKIIGAPERLEPVDVALIRRAVEECRPSEKITVEMPGTSSTSSSSSTSGSNSTSSSSSSTSDDPLAALGLDEGDISNVKDKPGDDWFKAYSGNLRTLDVVALWASKGLDIQPGKKPGTWNARCPDYDSHKTQDGKPAFIGKSEGKRPGWKCGRTGCRLRKIADVLAWFGKDAVDACCSEEYGRKAEPDKGGKPSPGGRLVKMATDACELIRGDDGTAYARVAVDGHRETMSLEGSQFKHWLCGTYYDATGATAKADAVREAIQVLTHKASARPKQPVYLRFANLGDVIYWDLGDDSWRAVEVTRKGWRIVAEPPVIFRRTPNTASLPEPARGGSLDDMRSFLNLEPDDWTLFKGTILVAARGEGPYFVLSVHGEQGSAKTWACRFPKRLLDPVGAAEIDSIPRDEERWVILARHEYLLACDNVSRITDDQSDILCRLATGGGHKRRKLYTDDAQAVCDFKRPVWLNGIPDFTERGDLLSRSITLTLPVLAEKVSERTLEDRWRKALPGIMGGLLDLLVRGLRRWDETPDASTARMADAVRWATACLGDDSFSVAYNANRASANEHGLYCSPLAPVLIQYLEHARPAPFGPSTAGRFRGTAEELRKAVVAFAAHANIDLAKSFPERANVFSNQLRRDAAMLRGRGVDVRFIRVMGERVIDILPVGGTDPAPAEPPAPTGRNTDPDPAFTAKVRQIIPMPGMTPRSAKSLAEELNCEIGDVESALGHILGVEEEPVAGVTCYYLHPGKRRAAMVTI